MKLRVFDFLGLTLCPAALGAVAFYVVAPSASGLGLLIADQLSLLICLPIGILYGIAYGFFQKRIRTIKGVVSALCFLIGAVMVIILYPPQTRYLYPSEGLKIRVAKYVQRCVKGYEAEDRIAVLRREKLFFDPFVAHEWKVSIWPIDDVKSLVFYIYEAELKDNCRPILVLRSGSE